MKDTQIHKGLKITVNNKHFGCRGKKGIVTSNTAYRWRGHNYFSVRVRYSDGTPFTMRFLASELDKRS